MGAIRLLPEGNTVRLDGPEVYGLSYIDNRPGVLRPPHLNRRGRIGPTESPKVYVVSLDGKPVYVGYTGRSISSRLKLKPDPNGAYRGYKFWDAVAESPNAELSVWRVNFDMPTLKQDADVREITETKLMGLHAQTIEAEAVYLIRKASQWPAFQTEIHFYQSTDEHRRLAEEIVSRYGL